MAIAAQIRIDACAVRSLGRHLCVCVCVFVCVCVCVRARARERERERKRERVCVVFVCVLCEGAGEHKAKGIG